MFTDVWVMNADGTNQVPLTGPGGTPALLPGYTWSPRGRPTAPRSPTRETLPYSVIGVMNADGTNHRTIVKGDETEAGPPEVYLFAPAWSPDSTKITYTSYNTHITSSSQTTGSWLAVVNADGTGNADLTTYQGGIGDSDPAWSPDGSQIAFASNRSGNRNIWIMNADGSGMRNLTNHEGDDQGPTWSPDGTKVAFSTYRSGVYNIWTMNIDGPGLRSATKGLRGNNRFEIWLASHLSGLSSIWPMNADTRFKNVIWPPRRIYSVFRPAWSAG